MSETAGATAGNIAASSGGGGIVQPTATTPDLNAWVLGFQLFGTALQSYGAYTESRLEKETLEYNAAIAEIDARQIQKQKKQELHKAKTAQRRLLARQIAATAASGRAMSGSPLDVMNRTESAALQDQAIIRSNAAHSTAKVKGQALFDKADAKSATKLGASRAFSNLLIGGVNTYARSNYFKKQGS